MNLNAGLTVGTFHNKAPIAYFLCLGRMCNTCSVFGGSSGTLTGTFSTRLNIACICEDHTCGVSVYPQLLNFELHECPSKILRKATNSTLMTVVTSTQACAVSVCFNMYKLRTQAFSIRLTLTSSGCRSHVNAIGTKHSMILRRLAARQNCGLMCMGHPSINRIGAF